MTTTASLPAPALTRILRHAGYETRIIVTNAEQLLVSLILPLLALGALTTTSVLDGIADTRINAATPGVLALALVSVGFTGQAIQTGFDRQYGVLRALATTPLGKSGLILGKITAVAIVALLHVAVLSTVAVFLGWQPKPTFGWAVLIGVLGVITFTALGLLIAGTVRAQATLAITNIGLVLIAAIGGVLMPLTRLHDALAGFVQLLPSAALGEGMRDALAHGHINIQATIVLAGWALILVAAAIRNFRWEN